MQVGINGMGRIGRLALRAALGAAHRPHDDPRGANRLEVADGRLTGRVEGPVVDRAAKAEYLRRWAAEEGLPLARTIAIGDGSNDLDMLAAAGLGIAFNAKPAVRAQAHVAINEGGLDRLLEVLRQSRT